MKANFVFLLSCTVSADNFLRGNDLPHDENRRYLGKGKGNGPPEHADPPDHAESFLAALNIDGNGGIMEFYDDEETIYVAVRANNDETMKKVNGLGPEVSGNPVAIFQHFAPPGESIPEALLDAKRRVDEKIRDEENNPIEYSQIPDAPEVDGEEDDHEDDRKLKDLQEALILPPEQRELICNDPQYPWGSQGWWYENFCRPETMINQDACACFTYRTGNVRSFPYDFRIDFWTYVHYGSLWMYTYDLINDEWVPTYEYYVQQGWWGHILMYGPTRYRMLDVSYATGAVYHWSHYTTSGFPCASCVDANSSPPRCDYCRNTNF